MRTSAMARPPRLSPPPAPARLTRALDGARRRPVVTTAGLAGALGVAFLLAPPMGTDLSAQVARAAFASRHGATPVDFGWYGGVSPYGYSLVTPPLMALFGPRPVGAVAMVIAAIAFTVILGRTQAVRPVLGGALGALCLAGNLVSGRITYAVGVAIGLWALVALTAWPAPPSGARARPDGRSRWRSVAAVAGAPLAALLASAASPVAGLFVGLAGVALALGDRTRWRAGLAVAGAAAVPLGVTGLVFGDGGWMNISALDAARACSVSLLVAVVVPRRPVRIGALLSAAGVALAYAVPTPVGLNATRLAVMFALPLLAAYGQLPRHRFLPAPAGLAALLVIVAIWQPPVSRVDLRNAGDPTADPGYFRPLLDELSRRDPAGRIEVVPTTNYWEAAYVPQRVPLARGWLRQADLARNPLFFDGTLDAAAYESWLRDNAVAYVAVADAPPSWVGRREAELIAHGLPYLTEVWRDRHWLLYAVRDPAPMVAAPGRLVRADAARVVFDVDQPGEVLVRVRWSRWLRLSGPEGCLAAGERGWTVVRVRTPGRYVVSGGLRPGPRCGPVR